MKNREQGKRELTGDRKMRLFFALWPAPELRQQLYETACQYKSRCGGRVMRADSIHMTLLFLGETPEYRLYELKQAADMVHGLRFHLIIDRIEAWRHNAIVYAGVMKTPEALAALAETLRSQVAAAGFKFDARAFAPHITLMRKVERLPESELIDDPMQWSVNEFVLVQSVPSESGVRYDIIGCWPLESV